MSGEKTIIEEVDYASEFQEFIAMNEDVEISETLKQKVNSCNPTELLKIVKTIGSTPIIINSVDVYNEDFLISNF